MADLPDISDLVKARDSISNLATEINQISEMVDKTLVIIKNDIIKRYREAGVTQDDCDHPFTKYMGMGDSECGYCHLDVRGFPDSYFETKR